MTVPRRPVDVVAAGLRVRGVADGLSIDMADCALIALRAAGWSTSAERRLAPG
jgi:hypothetical protein